MGQMGGIKREVLFGMKAARRSNDRPLKVSDPTLLKRLRKVFYAMIERGDRVPGLRRKRKGERKMGSKVLTVWIERGFCHHFLGGETSGIFSVGGQKSLLGLVRAMTATHSLKGADLREGTSFGAPD